MRGCGVPDAEKPQVACGAAQQGTQDEAGACGSFGWLAVFLLCCILTDMTALPPMHFAMWAVEEEQWPALGAVAEDTAPCYLAVNAAQPPPSALEFDVW